MNAHARIGTFDISPGRLDKLVEHFLHQVVPAFSAHAGFLGYQAYVDQTTGRYVGVSLWRTRAELEASAATARQALAVAFRIGAVPVGEPQILEQAFDAPPQTNDLHLDSCKDVAETDPPSTGH